MLELRRILELEVIRCLSELLAVPQSKLALVHQALVVSMVCSSNQRLKVTGAEAARECRIICMAENILEKTRKSKSPRSQSYLLTYLDLLEAECTFSYIVVDHQWIVDHDARLQEEAVFIICILINVWFVTAITRQFTTDCVLAEIKLGVISNEFQKCFS